MTESEGQTIEKVNEEMNEEIKECVSRQEEIRAELVAMMRNHKKTGSDRRTKPYYEKRIKLVKELGAEFQENDDWLRESPNEPQAEAYLLKKLDVEVTETIESYLNVFRNELDELGTTVSLSTTDNAAIKSLIRRQSVMISSLRRAMHLAEPEEMGSQRFKMKQRLWEEIENMHFKIWEKTDDPTVLGYDMDSYIEIETDILSTMSTVTHTRQNTGPTVHTTTPHIPLPKVQIPKFDGEYGNWPTFHDLFVKVVHEQPIAAVQKMWFLKSNVTGEAENLIRHLSLTENNYETAWNLLQDRFSNKRVCASQLLQRIIDHPQVNSDAKDIKQLHDTIRESMLALENVGVSTKGWDPLLLQILVKKLDRYTHNLYESAITNPKELQDINGFLKFLEQRFQTLESLGPKEKRGAVHRATTATVNCTTCKVCQGKDHAIYFCNKFLAMTPQRRLQLAQNHKLCINCLKPGHGTKTCSSRPCRHCSKKHNSLLHFGQTSIENTTSAQSSLSTSTLSPSSSSRIPANNLAESAQTVLTASSASTQGKGGQNYVCLATAKVRITATNGQSCEARAVLDTGSQVNLITQRLINKLSLSTTRTKLIIEGVGQHTGNATARVNVKLSSVAGNFTTHFEAYVMPKIVAPQPSINLDTSTWCFPGDIILADENFHQPGNIDILIGAEHYHHLLHPQQRSLGRHLPLLQNTVLGWVVVGKTQVKNNFTPTCAIFALTEEEKISNIMEKFWVTEDLSTEEEHVNAEHKACEQHFEKTISQTDEGKFVVRLPFAENPTALGNSQLQAERRFLAIEKKLQRDPALMKEYKGFMAEYEKLGHMEKIDKQSIPATNFFIPHHCVLKPDSTTTKLRVVFDASAKSSSGKSLNDILYNGPTVQSELFSVLLRFRMHKYVFTADIEKMYRQVLMHPDDMAYQLIVWRDHESDPYQYYKLKTVTYGTKPAPYLATKCLQYLAQQNKDRLPFGSEVISKDFYVDDCLSGANSITIAQYKQNHTTEVLHQAGFKLRKWCANDRRLLANVPPEDQEINLDLEDSGTIKTLGVIWRPKTDELCGRANMPPMMKWTKRTIASDLARIFDPLGIFGPVIVIAKWLMQQLWQLKVEWDEEIPEELQQQWTRFRDELPEINKITIQRHIFSGNVPTSFQLHTFVDASERAFGAAVYIRARNAGKSVIVRLLCAKSRIAPLKKLSIPRLELCAAVLGAELTSKVRSDLECASVPTFYWSDSKIVLSWIQSPSAGLHTFVANRVAKIQNQTDASQWHHVASSNNPADALSRGIQPSRFSACAQWLYGPVFLHHDDESWLRPEPAVPEFAGDVERRQKQTVTIVHQHNGVENIVQGIQHRNSFRFLLNTVGYLRRPFIAPKPQQLSLYPSELRQALLTIVRAIQSSEFRQDINDLKNQRAVSHTSQLSSLSPFVDCDGILRVGGRLEAATIPIDAKHPMVLPYNDPIVKLLFQQTHEENKHCGVQSLLAAMRQKFWPIKGKITARSTVHRCIICSRAKPKLFGQLMGNLPQDRVSVSRPFLNTGVDYCGPFSIHYKVRGKKPTKAYLAIFCCFATKAVHLELVTDLSTKSFIGALSRFIGRRGKCQSIYCDNATNFVGARNQLSELQETIFSDEAKEVITKSSSSQGIEFKFIPPRGPHFGGLWEAAVKSAKYLLTRDVSSANLTYEELETVIIGIEAILNSRPLTPMSSDPNDLTALTPGHFLIGEPLTAIAEPTQDTLNNNLVQRWELVSKLKYEFWKRWSVEYLSELQQRHKWKVAATNIQPGDMVIIKDDNVPVMEWKIGKIEKVYLGDDGRVRVADVKTSKGIYKRLLHLLAPLPTASPLNANKDESTEDSPQPPNEYLPNKRQRMSSPYS